MLRRVDFWVALAAIFACRWIVMFIVPLMDPSEPRYGEIARVMAESGDWITPWFDAETPFWGKPPLSFWLQALAIKWLGYSEFAVRLPAWLAVLPTLYFIFQVAREFYGEQIARWSVLVFLSAGLTFTVSGAVLTDPFLVLGTTWVMASVCLVGTQPVFLWRYGAFIGLAIGLLAKGPLALLLIAGPTIPFLLFFSDARKTLKQLPWLLGTLVAAVLVLPWYIAAEIKTPGFLHYFIWGEHVLRFIDPGWAGDLYGGAHKRPHGIIWLYLLVAFFPWSFALLWQILHRGIRGIHWGELNPFNWQLQTVYLLFWAGFTPCFFTLAGNVLWTYGLPALPALSILSALLLADFFKDKRYQQVGLLGVGLIPVLGLIASVAVWMLPATAIKSEKTVVQYMQEQQGDKTLMFVGKPTYSFRYYANGNWNSLQLDAFDRSFLNSNQPFLFAVKKKQAKHVLNECALCQLEFESKEVNVYSVTPAAIVEQKLDTPARS